MSLIIDISCRHIKNRVELHVYLILISFLFTFLTVAHFFSRELGYSAVANEPSFKRQYMNYRIAHTICF